MDRLTSLPHRPLHMSQNLMELAWKDDQFIYLVELLPDEGQPDDPTKDVYIVNLSICDLTGVEQLSFPRQTSLTLYDDPSVILTPADYDPVQFVLTFAQGFLPLMAGSANRLLKRRPLFERLMMSANGNDTLDALTCASTAEIGGDA